MNMVKVIFFGYDYSDDWETVAPDVKQWAYVDKYFKKEFENDKEI